MPFGTILGFNIENDLIIVDNLVANEIDINNDVPQFMDISRSDDECTVILEEPHNKRKRSIDSETDEDENDNSLEVVYETPLAKIYYKRNKRIVLDIVPETPFPDVPKAYDVNDETPIVTPPSA